MFKTIAERITTAQRKQLRAAGVPDSRVTEWKHGRSKPTYSQLKALSFVLGMDFCKLANDLADETASEETADYIRRMEAQRGIRSAQGALFTDEPLPPQLDDTSHALRGPKPRP